MIGKIAAAGVTGFILLVFVVVPFAVLTLRDVASEGLEYADHVVRDAVDHDDPETFQTYVVPGTELQAPLSALYEVFERMGSLGPVRGTGKLAGDTHLGYQTGAGIVAAGHYKARVRFERGPAIIEVAIIRHSDGWRVTGFSIKADPYPVTPDSDIQA